MIDRYLDETLPVELGRQLRGRGVDALTAQEAGRLGTSDEEQLAFALGEQRAFVTSDQRIASLAECLYLAGRHHAGIIIVSWQHAQNVWALLRMCLNLCTRESPESMTNAIYALEQFR